MPDEHPTTKSPPNSDDYIRRIRKNAAKRQLERAAKRTKDTMPENKNKKSEDLLSPTTI
jgi:replicative DNA helicase